MDTRKAGEALYALCDVAEEISGCAESMCADIDVSIGGGLEGIKVLFMSGIGSDMENGLMHIIGLAERGLKLAREFNEAAKEAEDE